MDNLESIALRATGTENSSNNGALESPKSQTSGALSIVRLTTDGLSSIDLAGKPIGWKESSLLSAKLKELFGDYFTASGTVNIDENANPVVRPEELFGTARLLWQILIQDGWSRERFMMALDGFVRKRHFGKDNWEPFDFTDSGPETDLHDEAWMLEQDETSRPRIESFFHKPSGQCLFRWRGTGAELPGEYERVGQ
jgi:hypothetical protein